MGTGNRLSKSICFQEPTAYIHAHVVQDSLMNTRRGSPCGSHEWQEYADNVPCLIWQIACHQQVHSM